MRSLDKQTLQIRKKAVAPRSDSWDGISPRKLRRSATDLCVAIRHEKSTKLSGSGDADLTKSLILQPLARESSQRAFCTLAILNTERRTIIVPEIEFSEIAMQMPLAAMLVDALHAAFEDAVVALDRVRMDLHARFAVRITVLIARVIHNAMRGELFANGHVATRFVGHQMAFAVEVRVHNRDDVLFRRRLDMERTSRTAALDKGQNRVLMGSTLLNLNAGFAADVGLVNLDDRARAAPRSKLARPSASRMRWQRNQAVLYVTPRMRCI
jgi:hypothetical protein